jgi:hypothetical protein
MPALMAWLLVAMSKVYPSGGDFAVNSDASIVPAPGRLSMTTGCSRAALSACPTMREIVSAPPPGPAGMIRRMDLVG